MKSTMKSIGVCLILCVLFACNPGVAQKIEEKNIKKHIQYLADDKLQGRQTGSEGERLAMDYIIKEFKKMKLSPMGSDGSSFEQAFPFKGGTHGTGAEGIAHNVVAFLDNKADKTIIIGAHFDHLGLGENGSSLDANPQGKIHNGADDNASGVAGVLELARYFKNNNVKETSNFLFICFSGEELGLHGSKYFTEKPTLELSNVNYMINMDMIGRLNPTTKSLSVSGSGTSPVWETLFKNTTNSLAVKTDSAGVGPSDHTSFYLKNIPVLHFFTGSHSDYHKPSDDWDKINYAGEKEVLELVITVIEKLDDQPKLAFLPTKTKSMGSSRSFKVTMGVMPSYTSDAAGLLVDGVSEGKPAQKAGILTGDVITQIGDYPIKDMQSYMETLGKFEKGQQVPVKIIRNKEEKILQVTF
jgi:Peptidase family M28/PDZ domain